MKSVQTPKDSWQSALEDVADYVGASPLQHYQGLEAVLELSATILASRPLRPGWDDQEPISESARAHLDALKQRAAKQS